MTAIYDSWMPWTRPWMYDCIVIGIIWQRPSKLAKFVFGQFQRKISFVKKKIQWIFFFWFFKNEHKIIERYELQLVMILGLWIRCYFNKLMVVWEGRFSCVTLYKCWIEVIENKHCELITLTQWKFLCKNRKTDWNWILTVQLQNQHKNKHEKLLRLQ